MNRSNKFFLLSLLLCGLTLQASEEAERIKRIESAREQEAIIADFRKTMKRYATIQAGLKVIADPVLASGQMITDYALMPGQMIMNHDSQGLGFTASQGRTLRAQTLDAFKDAQYGRCMTCTAATGAMLCTAGALYACGSPQVEPCLSAACLTGTFGYASTLIPCTDDKDNYSCKRPKQKTK